MITTTRHRRKIYGLSAATMGAMFLLLLAIYSLVISTDPCRSLKELAKDNKSRLAISNSISTFLSQPDVQSTLSSSAGSSFNLNEFSSSFDLPEFESDADSNTIQLYIKSTRADKRFEPPFSVIEVGIGYSRSQLVYKNELHEGMNTMFELKLNSNPRVFCGD